MKGSVHQRGEGWAYRVDLPKRADGKRRQHREGGFANKRAAERALTGFITDHDRGRAVDPNRQSLADFLDEWLAIVQPSVRPNTFNQYEHVVGRWIIPRIGGLRLQDVTPQHLQSLYAELSRAGGKDAQGLGPRSVQLTHTVLNMALMRAVEWRLIVMNPAAVKISLARREEKPMQTWSTEECKRFLYENHQSDLYPLWVLMLSTGLRRGEALGLVWEHVNLIDLRLAVVQTLVLVAGVPTISEPKTASSRRALNFPQETAHALDWHRVRQEVEWAPAAGSAWKSSGLVFTNRLGGPLDPNNVRHSLARACKAVGVHPLTPHGMRHTFASLALEAGVATKVVSEMLGHSSPAITSSVYQHTTPGMHKAAVDQIGALLFQ